MIRDDLAQEFLTLVREASGARPRSQQSTLGFSGVGHPCDRWEWSVLHGVPRVNDTNVLASMRGTAFHELLAPILEAAGWQTEVPVEWAGITGHADGLRDGVVLDVKTGLSDKVRALRSYGPDQSWRWQIQCYARGLVEKGTEVHTVRIVAFAVDSSEEVAVWEEPYDPAISDQALARRDRLDAAEEPPKPGMDETFCSHWCPFFDRDMDKGGCPSRLLGDTDLELDDPVLREAAVDMREAREDAKAADARKKAAAAVLHGVRGTVGDLLVKTVTREGSESVDVDAMDLDAYAAIVGPVPTKRSAGSSWVSITKARRAK